MIGRKVKYLEKWHYLEEDGEVLMVPGFHPSGAVPLKGKFQGRECTDFESCGEYIAFNAENSTVTLMTKNGLFKTVSSLAVRVLKEIKR